MRRERLIVVERREQFRPLRLQTVQVRLALLQGPVSAPRPQLRGRGGARPEGRATSARGTTPATRAPPTRVRTTPPSEGWSSRRQRPRSRRPRPRSRRPRPRRPSIVAPRTPSAIVLGGARLRVLSRPRARFRDAGFELGDVVHDDDERVALRVALDEVGERRGPLARVGASGSGGALPGAIKRALARVGRARARGVRRRGTWSRGCGRT